MRPPLRSLGIFLLIWCLAILTPSARSSTSYTPANLETIGPDDGSSPEKTAIQLSLSGWKGQYVPYSYDSEPSILTDFDNLTIAYLCTELKPDRPADYTDIFGTEWYRLNGSGSFGFSLNSTATVYSNGNAQGVFLLGDVSITAIRLKSVSVGSTTPSVTIIYEFDVQVEHPSSFLPTYPYVSNTGRSFELRYYLASGRTNTALDPSGSPALADPAASPFYSDSSSARNVVGSPAIARIWGVNTTFYFDGWRPNLPVGSSFPSPPSNATDPLNQAFANIRMWRDTTLSGISSPLGQPASGGDGKLPPNIPFISKGGLNNYANDSVQDRAILWNPNGSGEDIASLTLNFFAGSSSGGVSEVDLTALTVSTAILKSKIKRKIKKLKKALSKAKKKGLRSKSKKLKKQIKKLKKQTRTL